MGKTLKRHFIKNDYQMTKNMKSYSTSSVIREIKTEYMLRMAKLKKQKMSSVDEDTGQRESSYTNKGQYL